MWRERSGSGESECSDTESWSGGKGERERLPDRTSKTKTRQDKTAHSNWQLAIEISDINIRKEKKRVTVSFLLHERRIQELAIIYWIMGVSRQTTRDAAPYNITHRESMNDRTEQREYDSQLTVKRIVDIKSWEDCLLDREMEIISRQEKERLQTRLKRGKKDAKTGR